MRIIHILIAVLLLASCSSEYVDIEPQAQKDSVIITTGIEPFVGELTSRVNDAGDDFLNGDFIRLKIICPFVTTTQRGEHTDGNSYDAFYYLKRSGTSWVRVTSDDKFDISGTYSYSYSPSVESYYEAQQTPYVYVATTWSEERRFIAPSDANGNTSLYDHLTPVFHADQSKAKHYRASDVLWAQTFMQTGAWNIHLGFQHKMACLDITIDDSALPEESHISNLAVLTLEGMPDIDQAEIVVGDYYADASKSNSGYGYWQKSSCSYANNGKVLGIAVNDETARRAKVAPLTGLPEPGGANSNYTRLEFVSNTGTYTAYRPDQSNPRHYRLIVPPCNLDPNEEGGKNAKFWLRDDNRRFTVSLDQLKFEEGRLYKITLKLGAPLNPTENP